MDHTERNLDRLAALHAQSIVSRTKDVQDGDRLATKQSARDVDNVVTKALGVLQEDGVYACALYLLSRSRGKG